VAEEHYLLDNQQTQAGHRFEALADLFNASTFRHMRSVGLSPGWRVWEVGAGGASVPEWIAKQTHGYVLATDIDTSWLDREAGGFEVRTHDIGTDPAPDYGFDLVHARLVLVQRVNALTTMINALKPGGWVLLEEADPGLQPLVCPDEYAAEQKLANKLKMAFRSLMADLATEDEIEQHLSNVATGRLDLATSPMVSAWARKRE
jgi:SAM-dependent methyltransferase